MLCRERGMALVTILMLLAVLLAIATVFSDKVLRATREETLAAAREQALQAAGAGVEWARHQLAARYRSSAGWATYLAAASPGEQYPLAPVLQTDLGGVPVDIYLRDNPDGDGDPRRDSDRKLFVLSCARPRLGAEVRVESLCVLVAEGNAYRQSGGDARRSGVSAESGPAELWSAPVNSFQLRQ